MRFVALVLIAAGALSAADFEPLDRWRAAVLAGDEAALRAFYLSGPDAVAVTPSGKSGDPAGEESEFWTKLAGQGLEALNPKILVRQMTSPSRVRLVLRVELKFRSGGPVENGLIVLRQVWAERAGDWRILWTRRSDLEPLPEISLPQPAVPNTHLYPDPGDAKEELKTALGEAKADHKRVLVIFGATWCYDCHVLDATLRSPQVAPLVEANYHVVHINIGDHDANADLAERFQVPLNKGIPGLAVLDGEGRVVTSLKNGEFESAAKIGMRDVTGFLERWKPGK